MDKPKLDFDIAKVKVVDIGEVKPNPWNPKEQNTDEYARIKKGIQARGLKLPVIVRERGKKWEIVDGEQRYRACKDLGFKEIIIYNLGTIPDSEAKELTIWFQQQVPFSQIDLAELIVDHVKEPGVRLPYDEKEIAVFEELLKFDWNKVHTPIKESGSDEFVSFAFGDVIDSIAKPVYEKFIEAWEKAGRVTDNGASTTRMEAIVSNFIITPEKSLK